MGDAQGRALLLEFARAAARALAAPADLGAVVRTLECALGISGYGDAPHEDDGSGIDVEVLRLSREVGDQIADDPDARREAFSHAGFEVLAEALLSVVAPDWLPRFSGDQAARLFDAWFDRAPAATVLDVLLAHLSSVEPLGPARRRPRAVAAVAADAAGAALARRFGAADSRGVAELAAYAAATYKDRGGGAADAAAAALAALPDRAEAALDEPALLLAAFVPHAVRQLLEAAPGLGPPGARFAGDVAGRLCRRGHAPLVAAALAAALRAGGAAAGAARAAVAALDDSVALERLLEALLPALAAAGPGAAAAALRAALPLAAWRARPDVRLLLGEKLLARRPLPAAALAALVEYLSWVEGGCPGALADAAAAAAAAWADADAARAALLPLQAYATAALVALLPALGRARLDGHATLLPALLRGVSERLGSPRLALRRQAMRVGAELACVLAVRPTSVVGAGQGGGGGDADGEGEGTAAAVAAAAAAAAAAEGAPPPAGTVGGPPLFGDEDLSLLPEEVWEQAPQAAASSGAGAAAAAARRRRRAARRRAGPAGGRSAAGGGGADGDGYPLTETDSDDDSGARARAVSAPSGASSSSSSDSEFERAGLSDDAASDEEARERAKLQLRDISKALAAGDTDWKALRRALGAAEAAVRAAPDELPLYAVPLSRALLHARPPAWLAEESAPGESPPETQRFRALVATTVAEPDAAGVALCCELYSPSLDLHQRCTLLEAVAAAAGELAAPGSFFAPALPAGSGGAGGELPAPPAAAARAGRVTRIAPRALALRRERERAGTGGGGAPAANRFGPVALKWAAALLSEVDRPHHGVDLFSQRDAALLGRLLGTLGAVAEAAAGAPEALPLGAAVLALLAAPPVHAAAEPYVRRAALLAAGSVLAALPAPRLASAMLLPGGGGVVGGGGGSAAGDPLGEAVAEQLAWLGRWLDEVAASDGDPGCVAMAASCRRLHDSLAAGALAALERDAERGAAAALGAPPGIALPPAGGVGDGGAGGGVAAIRLPERLGGLAL